MKTVKRIGLKRIAMQKALMVGLLFLMASVSFAQPGRWSVALKSSYFGDRSGVVQGGVPSINDPLSIGFQMRYNIREDFALQYTIESLNGKMEQGRGDELSIHTAISTLIYPFSTKGISPYLISGLKWAQYNRNGEDKSKSELNVQMGMGHDITLIGNLISSVEVKIYSDGFNYLGWSTSFNIGLK